MTNEQVKQLIINNADMLANEIMNKLTKLSVTPVTYTENDAHEYEEFIKRYFDITRSCTNNVSIADIYAAWQDYTKTYYPILGDLYDIRPKARESKKLFNFLKMKYGCKRVKQRNGARTYNAVTNLSYK